MLTKILLTIVLLAVAGSILAQDTTKVDKYAFPPMPQEVKHADSLLAAGESTKGLAQLRVIIHSKADNEIKVRAHYIIGGYYKKLSSRIDYKNPLGNMNKAHEEFTAACALVSDSKIKSWCLYQAATTTLGKDKVDLLLQIDEESTPPTLYKDVVRQLAWAYRDVRDLENTRKMYRLFIEKYPSDRMQCADALYQIAQYTEGPEQVAAYEKVIKQYPDQVEKVINAYVGLASFYSAKGDLQKTIDTKYQILKKYPKHSSIPSLLESIMWDYQQMGEHDKAMKLRERIVKEYPNSEAGKKLK